MLIKSHPGMQVINVHQEKGGPKNIALGDPCPMTMNFHTEANIGVRSLRGQSSPTLKLALTTLLHPPPTPVYVEIKSPAVIVMLQ